MHQLLLHQPVARTRVGPHRRQFRWRYRTWQPTDRKENFLYSNSRRKRQIAHRQSWPTPPATSLAKRLNPTGPEPAVAAQPQAISSAPTSAR